MDNDELPQGNKIVSPEYRARCMDWALLLYQRRITDAPDAKSIVEDAKVFHAYVYDGK